MMRLEKEDESKLLENVPFNDYGAVSSGKKKTKEEKAKEKTLKTSAFIVFKYTDKVHLTLMILGFICALLSGSVLPIMGLFFGGMTNIFVNQAMNGLVPYNEVVSQAPDPLGANATPIAINTFTYTVEPTNYNGTTFIKVNYVLSEIFKIDRAYEQISRNESVYTPLTTDEFEGALNKYLTVYLAIGTFMLFSSFFQTILWERSSERLVHNIRKIYFSKILRQDISWYDQNEKGNLPNKLADDSERIREGTGYKVGMTIQYFSTFICGIAVGFSVNVQLTLLILCVTPFLIALMGYTSKFAVNAMVREQEKYAAAGAVAEEALSNIKTVNAFGGQLVEIKKYNYWLEEGRKLAMSKYNVFSVCVGLAFLIMYGAYGIGFAYGSYLVRIGISTPGSVFTVFFSVVVGAVSVGQALPFLTVLSGTIGVIAAVDEIIEREVVIDSFSKKGRKKTRITGCIEFKDVSFKYPSRPETMILDKLNLSIESGKKVAIVGSSGAGKSTIISLILRFYDTAKGDVCIDDIPVKDYNIHWLRKQIGLVSQEPVLFGVSIAENISYGAEDVSESEIIEAAKQANAHDFITSLPEGYETLVGDTGSQLSGGQKQRIAIARALVRDPKILLLDEATSALDAKSEGIVQNTLESAMKGRTTVIIAHRLSTIKYADHIYVMQNGKLCESGTHDELMGKKSVYYELVQAQMGIATSSQETSGKPSSVASSFIEKEKLEGTLSNENERVELNEHENETDDENFSPIQSELSKSTNELDSQNEAKNTGKHEHNETPWKVLDRKVLSKIVSTDEDENEDDEYETIVTTVRETREILYSDEDEEDDQEHEKIPTNYDIKNSTDVLPQKRRKSLELTLVEKRNLQFSTSEKIEKEITIFELLKMQKPEWFWLLVGFIGVIGTGLITPLFALYYGQMFRVFTLTGIELYNASIFWTYMFIGFAVFVGLVFTLQTKGMTESNEKLIARSRAMVFENILRQPVGWFDLDSSSPGVLVNRLARNAPLIKAAAGNRAGMVLSAFVTFLCAFAIAFICGWKLALALAVVVPIVVLLSVKQQRILKRNVTRDVKLMDEAGRIASECVRNIRTVQALAQEQLFIEIYSKNLELPYKEGKQQAFYYALLHAIIQWLMYFMYATAFRLGGYLIEIHEMTAEDIYRVFFALSLCAQSVGTAFSFMQDYNKARVSVRLLNFLMCRKSEIDSSSPMGARPEIKGNVEFRNVTFSYPTRPDMKVLKGLSFTIQAGKTLALVGESGCGKSTVISLLERFYDPLSGTILVDNYDTRTLNIGYFRSKIGLVTQEPILFDASIKDNIEYGAVASTKKVPFDQIKRAAEIANIHTFIMSLPERYDTMVGERGVQLSGGQKQRVAIARALIRDPKILLLDEATSALDTESEKVVQDALDEAKLGRTCIMVAHRLSTIRNADIICVVSKGKIIESGTHNELIALQGQYYQLTQRQSL